MNSNEYIFGVMAGIFLIAILAVVVALLVHKATAGHGKYDERQRLERGRAFTYAFWTLLIYDAVYAIFEAATGIVWCDHYTGIFIGIVISVVVFASICIMTDAYWREGERPKFYVLLFSALALINLGIGVINVFAAETPPAEDGVLNFRSVNFIVGVALLAIICVIGYKRSLERREEGEDQ